MNRRSVLCPGLQPQRRSTRVDFLQASGAKTVPDRGNRLHAARQAIQAIERLGLLSDDELERRLAAYRAQIAGDGGSTVPEMREREEVAAS